MPKYDYPGGGYVVIEGAADMPMQAFADLYEAIGTAAGTVKRVVKESTLQDWDGQPVDMATLANISPRQLNWLRDQVSAAVKEEQIDPEA